ncbi:TPA: DUF460 domain-containing protein [Candidatus Micrarchaeota archaeon]|nr:DUF460 domain-containing protein [Candidatus Micrarchaeota archaeon]
MHIIAGVDAGIKTGYALLDLNGNLVASGCVKEAGDEELVRLISQKGKPVIIAADTSPPSHFVQKIAARFSIRVFHPKESMTQQEKKGIGKGIVNPHIRDSYAAAVKAYRHFANRLRQIDRMDAPNKEELKKMVVMGKRVSDAIEQ